MPLTVACTTVVVIIVCSVARAALVVATTLHLMRKVPSDGSVHSEAAVRSCSPGLDL